MTANIAAVVVPTVTAVGIVLDMRISLAIARNNEVLLTKINGTYVKKEVLEAKLEAIPAHIRAGGAQ